MKKVKQFEVWDEGTIVLITPLTKRARAWMKDNIQSESWQWLGGSLGVDHHCADDLLEGMTEALC